MGTFPYIWYQARWKRDCLGSPEVAGSHGDTITCSEKEPSTQHIFLSHSSPLGSTHTAGGSCAG